MGTLTTKLCGTHFNQKEFRVIMVGLESAGKTTIISKLKPGQDFCLNPIPAESLEQVEYKNIRLTVMKSYQNQYHQNTQGLIFVIDSSDKERFQLALEEFMKIIDKEEFQNAAVLVFANKQDMAVMSIKEIADKLGLNNLKQRVWQIQSTCALTGDGVHDGFDWLIETLSNNE